MKSEVVTRIRVGTGSGASLFGPLRSTARMRGTTKVISTVTTMMPKTIMTMGYASAAFTFDRMRSCFCRKSASRDSTMSRLPAASPARTMFTNRSSK